jgi:hypothetical protein
MQGAGAPSPAPEYLPLEPPASAMSDAPGLLDEPVKSKSFLSLQRGGLR